MHATLDLAGDRVLDAVVPGAINFRDLGGLPVAAGGRVRRGVLYRAAMTHHVEPGGLDHLAREVGLRTVIDLRGPDELVEEGVAPFANHGIRHVHIPVIARAGFTPGQEPDPEMVRAMRERLGLGTVNPDGTVTPPRTLTPAEEAERAELRRQMSLDLYRRIINDNAPAFVAFFETLAEADLLPAVFHCSAGRDRTGVAAALILGLLDVPAEVIAQDYALSGQFLAPHAHRFMRFSSRVQLTPEEFGRMLVTTPEPMEQFLGWIADEHGSIPAFLAALGVPGTTLQTVAARLLEP